MKTTFRALVIHDPHLTHETPPAYKVEYWPLMKKTLLTLFAYARENKANAILWTGDIFHRKAPSKNPLWFMAEVVELFRSAKITNLGIAGNHDVKYGTAKLGLKGQPLALLGETPYFHFLDNNDVLFPLEGCTVRVTGCSYHHSKAHELVNLGPNEPNEVLVALGHFWFGPQTGEFYGEPVYGPDFLGKGPADVYCIGHHHDDQGHRVIDGKHYLVHGSITRTGAHKSDIARRPAAGWLEISAAGIETKILRPKFPSAEESMDLEKREQILQEVEEMDAFVAQLNVSTVEVFDPLEILEGMSVEQEVKDRATDYLDEAEVKVSG